MDNKKQSLKEVFTEAQEYYKKKNFKKAEIYCYKILSIDPNHFNSLSLLSNLFAINRDFNKAKELLEKAIKIQPDNTTILNNLGTAYKELGDTEKAITFYKKILGINSNHTNANYNLGLIFYGLKELKKSKEYLERTVKIQPNYAFAHFSLGNLQKEFKELKKAKESFQKAIELRPNFASAQNNLGLIFSNSGDPGSAMKCYKKAIEIDPKHAGAYNNLGRLYTETGELEKAIASHKEAIKLEPQNLVHIYYLSELDKSFLNSEVKNKTEKILNQKKTYRINLAYGNFVLSRYERKEKNYHKEFNYLIKAHKNYFELKKEKFELGVRYCFNDVLQISKFSKLKNINSNNKIKPIFIVGVPRCGSTLIEKIISSGKESIPMGEEVVALEHCINNKVLEKKSLDLGDAEKFGNELVNIYKDKGLIHKKSNFVFTDKSLNNFFYLELIKNVFPEAKVINCRRETLSSIMSILQNNLTELAWAHNLDNIFKYFDNYFEITSMFKKKYPGYIYDLDFEEFTKEPEIESKKLLKYCNLTWDAKCLEFYKRKDIISKTTSRIQIRKPIFKNTTEKYLPYKKFLDEYGKKYSWFN
jgi:Tfp pilus assembly protein PilF